MHAHFNRLIDALFAASEAQALYEDLSPPEPPKEDRPPANPAYEGKGRPTKQDRRNLDLNRRRTLE